MKGKLQRAADRATSRDILSNVRPQEGAQNAKTIEYSLGGHASETGPLAANETRIYTPGDERLIPMHEAGTAMHLLNSYRESADEGRP